MDESLILINNHYYYLDIDAISEFIKISSDDIESLKKTSKSEKAQLTNNTVINVTKYELVKGMVDVIFNMGFSLQDISDLDETEKLVKGVTDDDFNVMPIPFKLAFNTLTINKIIKHYEPTNRKNKRGDSETKK